MSFGFKLGSRYGGLGSIGSSIPHITGFYNFTGSNLSHYQVAVAGAGNALLAAWGDSTDAGVGSNGTAFTNNAQALSWPTVLAGLLSSGSWQNVFGDRNITAQSATINGFDSRQNIGTSWTKTANSIGGPLWNATTSTNSWSFAPTVAFDRADFFYVIAPADGIIGVDFDGGAQTQINTAGTLAFGKTTINATLGLHTINVKWFSGGNSNIQAIRTYNSATKEIAVLNAGYAGATALILSGNTQPYDPVNAVVAVAPHCIINSGGAINSMLAGTTAAVFQTQMQTMITAFKAANIDVILKSWAPLNIVSVPTAMQLSYIAALQNLVTANNVPFINIYELFGSTWQSGQMFDNNHPNASGYSSIAGYVNQCLASGFRSS